MKKIMTGFLIAASLAVAGWNSNAYAECDNAIFSCKNSSGQKLGEISVTCSLQTPYGAYGSPLPRCLPNFAAGAFASVDACKKVYPATVEACPNDPTWPSGYAFSRCLKYPGY